MYGPWSSTTANLNTRAARRCIEVRHRLSHHLPLMLTPHVYHSCRPSRWCVIHAFKRPYTNARQSVSSTVPVYDHTENTHLISISTSRIRPPSSTSTIQPRPTSPLLFADPALDADTWNLKIWCVFHRSFSCRVVLVMLARCVYKPNKH